MSTGITDRAGGVTRWWGIGLQLGEPKTTLPLEILPGGHDAKSGGLERYRNWLEPDLWRSQSVNGYRCLFLNAVDAENPNGLGFSQSQLDWLASQLEVGERCCEPVVLFMHAYPSDLREGSAELRALLQRHRVLMVDTGHTHYNEIANDGRTIYAPPARPVRPRKGRLTSRSPISTAVL